MKRWLVLCMILMLTMCEAASSEVQQVTYTGLAGRDRDRHHSRMESGQHAGFLRRMDPTIYGWYAFQL